MEVWDLYKEDRTLSGKTHVRGEELPNELYHLVIHVWIRNSKGEFVVAQRSGKLLRSPMLWECVGGSVLKGESSVDGAVREVEEELGIRLRPEFGKLVFSQVRKTVDGEKYNDILDVWLFEYDGEIPLEEATTNEVAYAAWMNLEQIKRLQEHQCFMKNMDYFFERADEFREKKKHCMQ